MGNGTELVNLEDIGLNNSILDFFRGQSTQIPDSLKERFIPDEVAGQFYHNALKDKITGYSITHTLGSDRKSFRLIMRDNNGRGPFDKEYIFDCLFSNGVDDFPSINTYINNKPIDYEDFKSHFLNQTVPKKGFFGRK